MPTYLKDKMQEIGRRFGRRLTTFRKSSYTKQSTGTGSVNLGTSDLNDVKKSKLVTSLHDLPLEGFITCNDGDLSPLIVDGNPTEIELIECWQNIQALFSDAIQSDKGANDLVNTIESLNLKIKRISALVESAKEHYNPKIINELTKEGYIYEAATIDHDALDRILTELKSDEIHMNMLRTQYNKSNGIEEGKEQAETKLSRDWFENILFQCSSMKKFNVTFDMSTYRFTLYYKELLQYAEQLKKKAA